MKRVLCLFLPLLMLYGCAASKPTPGWIVSGHRYLESYKQDFLTGREPPITAIHFRKAVEEIKKGGDADLLGKVWLTRMALLVAVCEPPKEGNDRMPEAAAAIPVNRNFFLFLRGDVAAVDTSLLPENYRPFWAAFTRGDVGEVSSAISAMEDPLSRLIASGLAAGRRLESSAMLKTAVETAAEQGWKRGLLAWLGRQRVFLDAAGEREKASAVQTRIEMIR